MTRRGWKLALAAVALATFVAGTRSMGQTPTVTKLDDATGHGLSVAGSDGTLRVTLLGDNLVHVAFAKDPKFFDAKSIVTSFNHLVDPHWAMASDAAGASLTTPRLTVKVDPKTMAVSFVDPSGKAILAETPGGRTMEAATVQGEQTTHVRQRWLANADESLYGLGQMQEGFVDIKGYDLDMWQHNTNVVVPFLVSSRGYGVLWPNLSETLFGDTRPWAAIPASCLRDSTGATGGVTMGTFAPANPDQLTNSRLSNTIVLGAGGRGGARGPAGGMTRWVGQIVPEQTGTYQIKTYSNGGIKVWFDGKLRIEHWRQSWNPGDDVIKVNLTAGQAYPIRVESGGDQTSTMNLTWKTPSPSNDTSLWSEVGDGIDYYFVYGPDLDNVIGGYRQITGQASMMPQWAMGLWQSRQKYDTQQESVDVVSEFRKRQIPFDNIVQDWRYWSDDAWGSQAFDPKRFPDPDGWVKQIHALNAHLMISVWGKFYTSGANFDALHKAGYLYERNITEQTKDWVNFPYTFYDAFNPGARKMFWDQINAGIYSKGVDAWWMDATEPDIRPSPFSIEGQKNYMTPTAMGTGSRVLNGYPLVNSQGVYEGQRSVNPNQRVFILTRSGFAGIQRYATATWSGDITSTWTAMAKQIPAGLGISIAGDPWWTMDCGGYTMDTRFEGNTRTHVQTPAAADEWRELNARWFEFATFCPILRVHGELQPREMWNIAGNDDSAPVYQAQVKSDKIRYALLPYIYSLAGAVTQDSGTIMRPLVMDFGSDATAREVTDQYMFGPAFMVAPVTTYKARSRSVYLPSSATWYDFWSGAVKAGGTSDAPAPYDQMPLFVKAGSIIPQGPEVQYAAEKKADPITIWVYAGADGKFNLYEDDGNTYNYEKGEFSRIPMTWHDATNTLEIGQRVGSFTGMLAQRTFHVVVVSKANAQPFSLTPPAGKSVTYTGAAVQVAVP